MNVISLQKNNNHLRNKALILYQFLCQFSGMPYNLFFYANICHICKCFGNEIHLMRCSRCRMISYCSKAHQKLHWPQHKDLCGVIYNVKNDEKMLHLFTIPKRFTAETWKEMKTNLMLLVAIKIGRRLEPYEIQMFQFPRACSICHKQDTTLLKDCHYCPSASFCLEHKNDPAHKDICSSFKLCFDTDMKLIMYKQCKMELVIPDTSKTMYFPNNMKAFLESYVDLFGNSSLSDNVQIAYKSMYFTRPLTILYVMKKIKYLMVDCMTIHIIGANMAETENIETWEILLHWLPVLTSLKIILIGPEVTVDNVTHKVCESCHTNKKTLKFEMHNVLYKDYVQNNLFVKPDLIVAYNAGIHECESLGSQADTWTSSLQILTDRNYIFILTAYTMQEAEKDQTRMKEIFGDSRTCTHYEKNPFSSLRPHRDHETEGVFYQNAYVMVYWRSDIT